eukprot:14581.XXX_926179_926286_1 [CDS] Oithona nana genome sequencing.
MSFIIKCESHKQISFGISQICFCNFCQSFESVFTSN